MRVLDDFFDRKTKVIHFKMFQTECRLTSGKKAVETSVRDEPVATKQEVAVCSHPLEPRVKVDEKMNR